MNTPKPLPAWLIEYNNLFEAHYEELTENRVHTGLSRDEVLSRWNDGVGAAVFVLTPVVDRVPVNRQFELGDFRDHNHPDRARMRELIGDRLLELMP